MMDGPRISNRKIESRLFIYENCVRYLRASLIFRQVRDNIRLSYREITETFNENRKNHVSSATVQNISLRNKVGIYPAVIKPMMRARNMLIGVSWCEERIV